MRLDFVRLVLTHPEFAAGAIFAVLVAKLDANKLRPGKRKPGVSPSSLVREFLLTETTILLPSGKRVSQAGASDQEVGKAIAQKHGLPAVLGAKTVKDERRRLEKRYGSSVDTLAELLLQSVEFSTKLSASEQKEIKNAVIDTFYQPTRVTSSVR